MKTFIASAFLLFTFLNVAFSQGSLNYISQEEYSELKSQGLLTGNEVILSEGMIDVDSLDVYQEFFFTPKAQGCSGYFDPPGPSLPLTSLDDGHANGGAAYVLPFTFCFFGDNYNQFWLNNNGNVSFDAAIAAFTPTAFPSNGNVMLAPFWADLDFNGSGTVHGTITPTAVIVNWVNAGYFSSQSDKLNTFQLVFTNGADPLVNGGNVAFHYADMQWTTGAASGGVNGFGGTPATAGANRGNNIDYFQIGLFDHEGTDYDGPAGATDGVSWLDDKSFYFDFCTVTNGNIAPIPVETGYCDTFTVCSVGDTLDITFPFLSPENNQITTVSYSAPTLNNVQVLSNIPGATGEMTIRIIGALETVGVHAVTVSALDNFSTPLQTDVIYQVEVIDGASVFSVEPALDFTLDCAPVDIGILNGPYEEYLWETGATTGMISIDDYFNDTLSVTISQNGCKFQLDSLIHIPTSPEFLVQGDSIYCEVDGGTFLEVIDSTTIGSITWGLPDASLDTLFSNTLTDGTYTITAADELGICFSDTTFTVYVMPSPTIFSDTIACYYNHYALGTTSYAGGVWSSADTAITFDPSPNVDNPTIITSTAGTYTVTYTDNACNVDVSAEIYFYEYPWTWVDDTLICAGATINLNVPNENPDPTEYIWSDGQYGTNVQFSEEGYYEVTLTNACHSSSIGFTVALQNCFIDVPNVISLSPGSQNNLWYVDAHGIKEFEVVITNRWGNVVFNCKDNQGLCTWNGNSLNGTPVEEGTYFYSLKATTEGNEEIEKQGFIQVVR